MGDKHLYLNKKSANREGAKKCRPNNTDQVLAGNAGQIGSWFWVIEHSGRCGDSTGLAPVSAVTQNQEPIRLTLTCTYL